MKASEIPAGRSADGKKVVRYVLENSHGMSVHAVSHGASIMSVNVPDRKGMTANVSLGYDTVDGYARNATFFGCIVGRFANRIGAGRFTLDGKEYTLALNNGANHLHGGTRGFDKIAWSGRLVKHADAIGIRWSYVSRDGEEGYPGTLKVTAEYILTEKNELVLEYWAVTDAPTPVNITNHSYWNLAGAGSATVLDQEITFNAPFYLPVDEGLIPTGEIRATADTPFDFSGYKPIGRDIQAAGGGYDHCFAIAKPPSAFGLACTARDPASGRTMQTWTTMPGFQFYTGNFLDGRFFPKHGGFCLETQHFPDSVNRGHFPSCILRPGETYHHRTAYVFSV